jgi:hypothetical protein
MLVENSSDNVPVLAVSPGMTALTGFTQADLLGCSCVCLAGPDTSVSSLRRWVMSLWHASGRGCSTRLLLHKKDGSPFWAYILSCPLVLPKSSTESQQSLCIVVDITATRLKRVGK